MACTTSTSTEVVPDDRFIRTLNRAFAWCGSCGHDIGTHPTTADSSRFACPRERFPAPLIDAWKHGMNYVVLSGEDVLQTMSALRMTPSQFAYAPPDAGKEPPSYYKGHVHGCDVLMAPHPIRVERIEPKPTQGESE